MDQPRTVSRETVIDLAAFLVRDMDRIADYARGVENLPKMHAKYLGQIEGERTALSYVAGMLFYPSTDALIAQVRRERGLAVPGQPGRVTTAPAAMLAPGFAGHGSHRPGTTCLECERTRAATAGATADVLAADARANWPVDFEEGEA